MSSGISKSGTWTVARIFVSSTFIDMQLERDRLVKFVFPNLRTMGERRRRHVFGIDLRWGIPVDLISEQRQVVSQCLRALDACRPYLFALVGTRRGWIPTLSDIDAETLEQYPGLHDALARGLSLTEIEILHALRPLDGTAQPSRVVAFTQQTASAFPTALLDALNGAGANSAAIRTLVYTKAPCADGQFVLRCGDETFDERATRELAEVLEIHGPTADDLDLDERVRALAVSDAVHLTSAVSALTDAIRDDNSIVILEGAASCGKTTLIAQLITSLGPEFSVIFRFLGSAARAEDEDLLLAGLCAEVEALALADPSRLLGRRDLFSRWSEAWAAAARAGVPKPVLLLDALDRAPIPFDALQWLIEPLLHGAAVVVSLDPTRTHGEALLAALRRTGKLVRREVEGLKDEAARRALITSHLSPYLKRPNEATWNALLINPSAHDPLFLAVVLAELRVHGRHDDLPNEIDRRFKGGRAAAIGSFLDRLEREAGSLTVDGVAMTLGALAHSKSGLSSVQLGRLIAPLVDSSADPQEMAEALLCQLSPFLQRRPRSHAIASSALCDIIAGRYRAPPSTITNHTNWDSLLASLLSEPIENEADEDVDGDRSRALRDLPRHFMKCGRLDDATREITGITKFIERLRLFGTCSVQGDLALLEGTNNTRVAELKRLLESATDTLYAAAQTARPTREDVAQTLAIQAGLLGLRELATAFHSRLAQVKRHARVLWAKSPPWRAATIRTDPDSLHLVISPNGKWLLIVYRSGGAGLWNTESLREHKRWRDASSPLWATFSPDGTTFALATSADGLRVFDTVTCAELHRIDLGNIAPTAALHLASTAVVVASNSGGIMLVDYRSGVVWRGQCDNPRSLAVVPAQAMLLVGTDRGTVLRFTLPLGAKPPELFDTTIDSAVISIIARSSGGRAFGLAASGLLIEWDLDTNETRFPFLEFRSISDIALLNGEQTLGATTGSGELVLHDLSSYNRRSIKATQNAAVAVAAAPHGYAWVAAQRDDDSATIIALHSESGCEIQEIEEIRAASLSPDGRLAVEVCRGGRVWIYAAHTGESLFDAEPKDITEGFSAAFTSQGHALLLGFLRQLVILDPWKQSMLASLGAFGAWESSSFDGVRAIGVAPDDAFFVAGDSRGHIGLFNWHYELFSSCEVASPASAIAVSPEHEVVVAHESGAISKIVRTIIEWGRSEEPCWAMAASFTQRVLYTGHRGGRIGIWSLDAPGNPVYFDPRIGSIEALHMVSSERVLAAAGRLGTLCLLDVDKLTRNLDLRFPSAVENMSFSRTSDLALVSLAGGHLVAMELRGFDVSSP